MTTTRERHSWTFLSNHAHVMVCLAREPEMRMRDLADAIGITERAVQRIVAELVEEGYLTVRKDGRRNRYAIRRSKPLRHPVEGGYRLTDLLALLA